MPAAGADAVGAEVDVFPADVLVLPEAAVPEGVLLEDARVDEAALDELLLEPDAEFVDCGGGQVTACLKLPVMAAPTIRTLVTFPCISWVTNTLYGRATCVVRRGKKE